MTEKEMQDYCDGVDRKMDVLMGTIFQYGTRITILQTMLNFLYNYCKAQDRLNGGEGKAIDYFYNEIVGSTISIQIESIKESKTFSDEDKYRFISALEEMSIVMRKDMVSCRESFECGEKRFLDGEDESDG